MLQSIRSYLNTHIQQTTVILSLSVLSTLTTSAQAQNTPDVTANTPVVSAAITSAATAAMPATFAVPVVTLTPAPPNRHWNRRG